MINLLSSSLKISSREIERLRALTPTLDQLIGVNNYGRSGSMLLQSLFDWHPNTISTPGIYISRFYPFYEKYGSLPTEELIDRFLHEFELMFDPRRPCLAYSTAANAGEYSGFTSLGPNRDQIYQVDRELFRLCLSGILADYKESVPRKLLFQAVHVAYRYALDQPGEIDSNTRIVYPLHTPIPSQYTAQVAHDFPQAKYLLMVRKPMDTTASMVRHLNGTGETCFFLYGFLYQSLFGGVPSAAGIDCKALRMEDLHTAPRETMQRVCDWLELAWDQSLIKSTINGKEWWGDSDSLKVNGFSKEFLAKRHHEQLRPIDRFRLNVLLAPKYDLWNYEIAPADKTLLRKLVVLPLLVVPFVMEWTFLIGERKDRMAGTCRTVAVEPLPRPIMYLLWLSGAGTVLRYLDIRRHLLISWLATFAPSRPEAPLL